MLLNTQTAPHFVWGEGCDGWRLLDLAHLSVIEERMPSGTSEIWHQHEHAHQLFYVLDGTLRIDLDSTCQELASGDAVHIPPRIQHQVRNESDAPARFLVISSPSAAGDRQVGQTET